KPDPPARRPGLHAKPLSRKECKKREAEINERRAICSPFQVCPSPSLKEFGLPRVIAPASSNSGVRPAHLNADAAVGPVPLGMRWIVSDAVNRPKGSRDLTVNSSKVPRLLCKENLAAGQLGDALELVTGDRIDLGACIASLEHLFIFGIQVHGENNAIRFL